MVGFRVAGANDGGFAWVAYREGGWDPPDAILEEAALGLVGSVQILADAGAVNFVVKSLPVVSYAPLFCGLDVADAMGEYFNSVLEAGLGSLDAFFTLTSLVLSMPWPITLFQIVVSVSVCLIRRVLCVGTESSCFPGTSFTILRLSTS